MFDFPNAPTPGQVATNGQVQYRWDGSKWTSTSSDSAVAIVSDTPPASPKDGQLWFDSVNLQMYTRYNDGNSSQWVPINNQTGALAEAPQDGAYYARRNGAWANTVMAPQIQNNVGRNLIHNSMFNISQRGVGPWTTGVHTADRWIANIVSPDTTSFSISAISDAGRGQIGDEAAIYTLANNFTGTATGAVYVEQRIEGVRRLAGKTVTISLYAIATPANKIGMMVYQAFGTGGSPSATTVVTTTPIALGNTIWTRCSWTVTLPSVSGKTIGTNNNDYTSIRIYYTSGAAAENINSGGIGQQSGSISLWGVQVEIGTVATPLEKIEFAEDLRRCQRFYVVQENYLYGYAMTANMMVVNWTLPVRMRAPPTITLRATSPAGEQLPWANARPATGATVDATHFANNMLGADITISGFTGMTAPQHASLLPGALQASADL